ncbi:arylesterase [Desulfonatronospira sp.]|uniref:arylesterase n=1 Tax=Desulfonatronospira sp. TaxID=1962951 RepID=UPI0025BAE699|nr:arylesterase [Desulfonatronospira sp.]
MITILALGDSLTAGYGLGPGMSFASRLEKALTEEGWEVSVINGGISGDTTLDGLRRLDGLLRLRPDLVLVELGPNDFFMELPLREIRTNLDQIISACLESNARVLLAGFESLQGYYPGYDEDFHKIYREIASSRQVPLCPDFLPGIPQNPELTLPDGVHPNDAGTQKIVEHILPAVKKELKKILTRAVPVTQ